MHKTQPSLLTEVDHINTDIRSFLNQNGVIFKIFDQQDSGCVSYGVELNAQRWFVKESSEPRTVESLRRAIALHSLVQHTALPRLHNAFKTPKNGLALVYDWLPGEILYDVSDFPGQAGQRDPKSAHARFCALPVEKIIAALSAIYDLHRVLAVAGFIAVDFYDGCILYDFVTESTFIVDLDEYRPGPFLNPTDRLYGSSRFMAPEEFQLGARIDQITNVFTLGRTALVFLSDGDSSNWRGDIPAKTVIEKATQPERANRYSTVAEFVDAWKSAFDQGRRTSA